MEKKKGLSFLRFSLGLYVLVVLVYGLGYAFFSAHLVEMSGSDPVPAGWLRWSGGVLIALAIGAMMVMAKPEKQRIFVRTIALGCLFTSIALFYGWVSEPVGEMMFTAVPAILTLLMCILLIWSCNMAKDILDGK